ncbi:hypothetical protein NLU14_08195 [Marinobacter sp. 71-i]|uniref:Uncharacterized protein n=1 Tax=Marinobacter iranensis TaxID=2962607 RepID=A0ABT5Y954_9GAMM|nr:hypothetical protein [Marinobacter iranensis]MDF0750210.1 hypothetical protein [Marinobacter iranensis]
MLRALVAVLAIIGVIALGIFGPRWLMSEDRAPADQGEVLCDLLNDTCSWEQQGRNWQAQLKKEGVQGQGTEYHLTIKTDSSQPRLLAVLRGESMYLGEYPVPMARAGLAPDDGGQLWEARFTAPFCTTDPKMTWRVDLQAGMDQETAMPVKLTFIAEGRA